MDQLRILTACPVCESVELTYLFEIHGYPVLGCKGCKLTILKPMSAEYKESRFSIIPDELKDQKPALENYTEIEASKKYFQMLVSQKKDVKDLLLVAEAGHCFADVAKGQGINVLQHITVDSVANKDSLRCQVDAAVVIYQLEKSPEAGELLNWIYEMLKPGGVLLLVTPSLDSLSARFFGQAWVGWRPENRYYFDNTNIQLLLWRYGFNEVWLEKDLRMYTLEHINERASSFPKTWVTGLIHAIYKILPIKFHNNYFHLPSSGVIVTAFKSERRVVPILSIILPVYNESATVSILIDQLLDLSLTNVQKEIIIVESNSQDNSRELVLKYKDHPGIKIVLQNKPKGKGNAVREGMKFATGDILMIQDADLEYDLNDYPALLEPIQSFRTPFILGARHGGRWKMRHFNDQQQISAYFNFGHIVFTFLINLLYGQNMKDPFTMYKLFRRDCMHNLVFECDRFDFDFELVIKLIRKGYTPLEIPVNYNSRSFKEGKKVRMFRDPLTWIQALVKYRFARITKD